jgi:tetratricopeptide (TPR) repeat protein
MNDDEAMTNCHPFNWFPSTICLSALANDRSPEDDSVFLMQKSHSAWLKYFIPVPQCIVHNSCLRHVRWYSSTVATYDDKAINGSRSLNRFTTSSQNHIHKDTSSMILQDPIKARNIVMEFVRNKNYEGAIIMAKNLLRHYQTLDDMNTTDQLRFDLSNVILALHGQIVVLCLIVGRKAEASRFITEAAHTLKDLNITDPTNTMVHTKSAIDVLLRHGLILFSNNKISQAMKACRGALQIAISLNSYQDTIVSVLLCNIGVFHLESGEIKASIRSLEESLEVQRSILRNGTEARQLGSADEAIYRLAITMGNLAIACERSDQIDRSISLLEESITLYESIDFDTSIDEEIVTKRLLTLIDKQNTAQHAVDDTMINTSDEAEGIISFDCPFTDLNQSGHSDAVQSFLDSSMADDDEYDDNSEAKKDDDERSNDSERSMTLFGNSDGVPSSRVNPWLWLDESDNHDFLLLGSLVPELSAEKRVHEALLFWNGKQSIKDSGESSREKMKEILKSKLNFNGENVLDADLYLNEIHKQAMIYLDDNNIDAAIDLLLKAVRSHRAKYGETHHLVGSAIHNIGMVLFFAQRYSDALVTFENAVLIRDEALGSDHPDVVSSLIKIALIHLAMGNAHDAHDAFSDIRDKLLHNLKGYGLLQLAKVHNNIGVIAYEFGDLDNALESFKSAYDYQRQIWKKCSLDDKDGDDESSTGYRYVIKFARANTLSNMAFIYVKAGDKEKGLELYDRAYNILFSLLPKHHPFIANVLTNIDILVEAMYHE